MLPRTFTYGGERTDTENHDGDSLPGPRAIPEDYGGASA